MWTNSEWEGGGGFHLRNAAKNVQIIVFMSCFNKCPVAWHRINPFSPFVVFIRGLAVVHCERGKNSCEGERMGCSFSGMFLSRRFMCLNLILHSRSGASNSGRLFLLLYFHFSNRNCEWHF